MTRITKPQVVDLIAAETGGTKADIARIIDHFLFETGRLAGNGHDVYLHGFGTFRRKDKPARMARNPQTGAPVDVAAKQVLVFTAAKAGGA